MTGNVKRPRVSGSEEFAAVVRKVVRRLIQSDSEESIAVIRKTVRRHPQNGEAG